MAKTVIWSEPATLDLERAVAYMKIRQHMRLLRVKEQSRTLNKFAKEIGCTGA